LQPSESNFAHTCLSSIFHFSLFLTYMEKNLALPRRCKRNFGKCWGIFGENSALDLSPSPARLQFLIVHVSHNAHRPP
jgi:hypothetical protein